MIISKISRGIVVCIFTIFIITLVSLNILSTVRYGAIYGSILLKVIYILSLIVCTSIYSLIKEKLSKRNFPKKQNLIIRYLSVIVLAIVIKMIVNVIVYDRQLVILSFLYTLMGFVNSIVLKKIIYNISKSDVLSVIGMLMYLFLPIISSLTYENLASYLMVFLILMSIMLIQIIIDELKQIGLKNKKYILFSILLGVVISISMVFGMNSVTWIFIGVVTLFSTSNLDKTHINFPNKFINMLRQRSKELLYRFERIYINKILISLFIIVIVVLSSYAAINYLINNFITNESVINFINRIKVINNVKISIDRFINIDIINFFNNLLNLVNNSKLFTLILIIYIIFIEFLNVALRRKYDTKSTIIKVMFFALIVTYAVFNQNYIHYTQIMQVFLILISIINTTNLYLNREERIKLLNS